MLLHRRSSEQSQNKRYIGIRLRATSSWLPAPYLLFPKWTCSSLFPAAHIHRCRNRWTHLQGYRRRYTCVCWENRTPLFLPAYQVRDIQQITTGLFRHRRLWLLQEPARILPRCHSHRGLHRHRLHPRKCLANYFLPHRVLPNILLRFHKLRDQLQSPIRPHRYLAKRVWLLQVLRYIHLRFHNRQERYRHPNDMSHQGSRNCRELPWESSGWAGARESNCICEERSLISCVTPFIAIESFLVGFCCGDLTENIWLSIAILFLGVTHLL